MSIRRLRPGVMPLLLGWCLAPSLLAQTIGLTLGDGNRVSVSTGAKLTVPLNVDLTNAGGSTLGSLQAGVTWGVGKLRLDSIRVASGSGFSLTANTTNAAGGSLTFNAYHPAGLASSARIANLYFTAGTSAGGTSIELTPTAAGTPAGETIASLLMAQGLDVCVAGSSWSTTTARWGDANASGGVNVTDAQQLARYAVALTVTNLLAVEQRGDVNADGLVDVLDALLVARFSAGLPAGTRVNTVMAIASNLPPVAGVEIDPAAPSVLVGQKRTLRALLRDAEGTSLVGCYPVSWSSSAAGVVTVSATGVVTGKAVGTATIRASAGGQQATAPTTVLASTAFDASAGLLAYYPFNGNAMDESGNGLHGNVRGATLTFDRFGLAGRAYEFGDQQDIEIPGGSGVNPLPISISVWYYLEDDATVFQTRNLFGKYVAATWNGYNLLIGNWGEKRDAMVPWYLAGRWNAMIGDYGQKPFHLTNPGYWGWNHVVFVVDSTQGYLYLNGNLLDTHPWLGEPMVPTSGFTWRVGGQYLGGGQQYYAGRIDDIRVYGRALNAQQVLALWGLERPQAGTGTVQTVDVRPRAQLLAVGQSHTMTPVVRDGPGNLLSSLGVTWTSSNPAVAKVSAAGVVTGVAPGTASITASSGGKSGSAAVKVPVGNVVYQGRAWDGVQPAIQPAAYLAALDSLIKQSPTAGYCDLTLASWELVNNQRCPAGSHSMIAFRVTGTFKVEPAEAGTWFLRLGLDAGAGAAWSLNGVPMGVIGTDVYSDDVFTASVPLSAGMHEVVVVGFENCCDGPASSRVSRDNINWAFIPLAPNTPAGTADIPAAPSLLHLRQTRPVP